VVPSESNEGPGTHERVIPRTQSPANKLASGVRNPTIKPAPLASNRDATAHTSGVRPVRTANSTAPNATALPPSAIRNRSSPMPGRPLGKVENSRCSGPLPLAHTAKTHDESRLSVNVRRSQPSKAGVQITSFEVLALEPILEVDDAPAEPNRDRLSPITGAQFFHNVLDMDFYGFLGD
jgi:hypothetical protein